MAELKPHEIALLQKVMPHAASYVTSSFNPDEGKYFIAGQHPLLAEPVGISLTPAQAVAFCELTMFVTKGLMAAAEQLRAQMRKQS
jgi:hypothetical protein